MVQTINISLKWNNIKVTVKYYFSDAIERKKIILFEVFILFHFLDQLIKQFFFFDKINLNLLILLANPIFESKRSTDLFKGHIENEIEIKFQIILHHINKLFILNFYSLRFLSLVPYPLGLHGRHVPAVGQDQQAVEGAQLAQGLCCGTGAGLGRCNPYRGGTGEITPYRCNLFGRKNIRTLGYNVWT